MSLVDDHKTVQQFAPDGADEAFRDRVHARRAQRRLDDLDVEGGEYGVERRIRNPNRRWVSSSSISRFRASWVTQGSGWVRGDAEDVYPTGGVLEDEERVEPLQGDRVEVEQIVGQGYRTPREAYNEYQNQRQAAWQHQ